MPPSNAEESSKTEAVKGKLSAKIVSSLFDEVQNKVSLKETIGPGLKSMHPVDNPIVSIFSGLVFIAVYFFFSSQNLTITSSLNPIET